MPPLPTSSSSSYLSAIISFTATGEAFPVAPRLSRQSCVQSLFPDRERLLQLLIGEDQRAEHADAVRVDPRLQKQEATIGRLGDDRARELWSGPLRLPVLDELQREHGAETPHIADCREALLPGEHAR